MKLIEQYNALVEIMAHARVIAALSDNSSVVDEMETVKKHTVIAAVELGCEEALFNSDSIARYMELIKKG